MGVAGGPDIIENGLVLSIDARDRNSYISGSNIWFNLINNNSSGSLTNGPTFTTGSGGGIVFDGVDDYGIFYNIICTGLGFSGTVEVITNATGSVVSNEREGNNDYGNGYFDILPNYTFRVGVNSKADPPYAYYLTSSFSGSIGSINHYIASYRIPSAQGTFQISGSLGVNGNFEPVTASIIIDRSNANPQRIEVCRHRNAGYGTSYSSGTVYIVRIYNRQLSQNEMTQNYNATKARFGL